MQRLAGFMRTYWSRGEPGRPTPQSLWVLMQRWWLVAFCCKVLGSSWDVSWHFKWLRDDLAPPHLLNTVGTGIAIVLVLVHTFTGYGAEKRSLRILQTGTIIFVIAGPLDVINHRVNGLDITSWSPSHMLLYAGTAIMLIGVIHNWYRSYPRQGRFAWQYTAGLTALCAFLFEDFFFPNFQQEYGILSIAAWFRGAPYAEPTLLRFAADQLGHPVGDVAVQNFALPIPDWVYPVWTIGVCAVVLVLARVLVGRFWAATMVAALYVGYRCLIWPALYYTGFPPSSVPFWLLAVGVGVDTAFLVRLHPHIRAVVGSLVVTAFGYGALAVQTVATGTPMNLGAQSIEQMRGTFEAGGALRTPPVDWLSASWAWAVLAAVWIGMTIVLRRTLGGPRPSARAMVYAPEPPRDAAGHLAGIAEEPDRATTH